MFPLTHIMDHNHIAMSLLHAQESKERPGASGRFNGQSKGLLNQANVISIGVES